MRLSNNRMSVLLALTVVAAACGQPNPTQDDVIIPDVVAEDTFVQAQDASAETSVDSGVEVDSSTDSSDAAIQNQEDVSGEDASVIQRDSEVQDASREYVSATYSRSERVLRIISRDSIFNTQALNPLEPCNVREVPVNESANCKVYRFFTDVEEYRRTSADSGLANITMMVNRTTRIVIPKSRITSSSLGLAPPHHFIGRIEFPVDLSGIDAGSYSLNIESASMNHRIQIANVQIM